MTTYVPTSKITRRALAGYWVPVTGATLPDPERGDPARWVQVGTVLAFDAVLSDGAKTVAGVVLARPDREVPLVPVSAAAVARRDARRVFGGL